VGSLFCIIFTAYNPEMAKSKLKYIVLVICVAISGLNLKAQSISEFSTNLPLLIIDTEGREILDEPKIMAKMKIIDNAGGLNRFTDAPTDYNGHIGIEIRGTTSKYYPQKPYGIETRTADGENLNIPVLGLPEENDWVLLSNYNDKSFMRNILGYKLFEMLGNYAPRARLVEVIVNNEYQGIYVFGEKIKRDKNRVDVAKLKDDDNSGEELTGGYIFKVDYYTSYDSWLSNYHPLNHPQFNVHFVYHDPKWDELTSQQKTYIKNYVNSFESNLYSSGFDNSYSGYRNYIDVKSFIDYFIVSEISRNNDGFKKSRYFHKDKNGKITAGPVWDFDWAWKNINECYIFKATDGSGWAYKVNDCNPDLKSPGWMIRLFYDENFKTETNCRYFEARATILSNDRIFNLVDSLAALVENAQERHFERWQILGKNVGAPEVGEQPSTYEGEVQKLKEWISLRLNWLDQNMIGSCPATFAAQTERESWYKIYPNPATSEVNILAGHLISQLEIFDITGKKLLVNPNVPTNTVRIDITSFQPGIYLLKITDESGRVFSEKFMVN
jgi:hypothetical protein